MRYVLWCKYLQLGCDRWSDRQLWNKGRVMKTELWGGNWGSHAAPLDEKGCGAGLHVSDGSNDGSSLFYEQLSQESRDCRHRLFIVRELWSLRRRWADRIESSNISSHLHVSRPTTANMCSYTIRALLHTPAGKLSCRNHHIAFCEKPGIRGALDGFFRGWWAVAGGSATDTLNVIVGLRVQVLFLVIPVSGLSSKHLGCDADDDNQQVIFWCRRITQYYQEPDVSYDIIYICFALKQPTKQDSVASRDLSDLLIKG